MPIMDRGHVGVGPTSPGSLMKRWSPLVGARIVLRDLRPEDLDSLAAYRSDPVVAQYQGWSPPFTAKDAQSLYASVVSTPFDTPGTWYQLAVAERESDTLLGDIGLHFLDTDQVEIGFTLARERHGQGWMREALILVLGHLFFELSKHRVIATTDARNVSAQHLLDALGFRLEGRFVENVFFKGAWGDELQFACLAREWRARLG